MQHRLTTPVTREDPAPLRAGDTVLLSGTVYTARDAAHKRMMELLDAGKELPFPVEGSALYYVGPTPERPGETIGSAGPTTSGRMDAYSPRLLDLGQAIMIGKGARNRTVKEAVIRNGAVYLAALGGAGALMAASVKELEIICWEDLGCEAVRRLEVADMPLTVILDAHGGDLYESGPAAYREVRDGKKTEPFQVELLQEWSEPPKSWSLLAPVILEQRERPPVYLSQSQEALFRPGPDGLLQRWHPCGPLPKKMPKHPHFPFFRSGGSVGFLDLSQKDMNGCGPSAVACTVWDGEGESPRTLFWEAEARIWYCRIYLLDGETF